MLFKKNGMRECQELFVVSPNDSVLSCFCGFDSIHFILRGNFMSLLAKMRRGMCFFALSLCFAGCASYQPPFTHHLNQRMTFADVLSVAQEEGYRSYCEIADYKGYRLLCFKNGEGEGDVFLVVNKLGKPMLRTLEYGTIDEAKLVNFVDDLLRHTGRV